MTSMPEVRLSTPSDREVVVSRAFDAPRELVFDAFTRPELVIQWLWGPDEWRIVQADAELRVGGAIRYVWRHTHGAEMGLSGTYLEIERPERTVHTEIFDEDWTGGEARITTVFTEAEGVTTMTMTILYSSKEARDGALATPMAEGMGQGYRRLDALLASMV